MILEHLSPFELNNYNIKTCVVESLVLKDNPLGDPVKRFNPVLEPKNYEGVLPVLFILAGYSGDGAKYFSFKSFESNFIQQIDQQTSLGQAPKAIYVFVNAWTLWGGSQFINSQGAGKYEDYIISELVSTIKDGFDVSPYADDWTVFGGSSGGYGALHLGTKYPDVFKNIISLAPDSFFDISLLPEIYHALPYIKSMGGIQNIKGLFKKDELKIPSHIMHKVFNVIAMASCYAPVKDNEYIFPIDESGELDLKIWETWLQNDPLYFLRQRKESSIKLNPIYLAVGDKDEYGLQYGARKIKKIFESQAVKVNYTEFKGTHRDLSKYRTEALKQVNIGITS